MKTDKHKTKVKFLFHEGNQDILIGADVFAFFPEEKYNGGNVMFTSYEHIGQHSACHIDYANECRPATPEEYKDLKSELESLGYNLEIVK